MDAPTLDAPTLDEIVTVGFSYFLNMFPGAVCNEYAVHNMFESESESESDDKIFFLMCNEETSETCLLIPKAVCTANSSKL